MSLFSKLFSSEKKNEHLERLIANSAIIIDVRTAEEYANGHVKGSTNIALQEIHDHVDRIKGFNKPIITCCLSGKRSQQATSILSKEGIECENGGGWKGLIGAVR